MKKIITATFLLLVSNLFASTVPIERWVTSNGANVVFSKAPQVPILEVDLAFFAGSAYEDKNFGLAALTTSLMSQGSNRFNTSQIAEQLADVGAQYHYSTTRDMALFQLKTLAGKSERQQALATFTSIITEPSFKQSNLTHQKKQQIMSILQSKESPDDVANTVFMDALYKNHPYGHPVKGTEKNVKALSMKNVKQFYRKNFVAKNAVLVMVGAISSEQAHQISEQLLSALPSGDRQPALQLAQHLDKAETISINFPSSQTMVRLGQVGIDHQDADYFPLLVGNYILGGGTLVSRLAIEVRENRGLTYGVVSQFQPLPGKGPFVVSLSTKNEQAPSAIKLTHSIVADFIETGPSNEELEAAKNYIIGSFPLSLESNSSTAAVLMRSAFYNLPDDYLETYSANVAAVSATDIKQAFAKLLKSKKLLLVTVGKNEQ